MNGNKLKCLRENKGLLQKELGNQLNISPSTIGMYEQNRREPDNHTLKKIANLFEVSTDYLLDNENKIENQDIYDKEILRDILVRANYLKKEETFTDNDFNTIIDFLKINKKYIKNSK